MDTPLAELMKYKPNEIDKYLATLQKDLNIRENINKKLEKEVKEKDANALCINNFMDKYDSTITNQLNLIKKLNDDIKTEFHNYDLLCEKNKEFQKLITSENYLDIKKRLNEIKSIKNELESFLKQRGIQAPKI